MAFVPARPIASFAVATRYDLVNIDFSRSRRKGAPMVEMVTIALSEAFTVRARVIHQSPSNNGR